MLSHLVDIASTQPELVDAIGLCNFDTATTARVCEHLQKIRGDVGIVSNQVQYSLIDQRPRFAMAKVCEQHGIKLLTYGTFVRAIQNMRGGVAEPCSVAASCQIDG